VGLSRQSWPIHGRVVAPAGERGATALLGRGQTLALTHQQLAQELGTVREIVSRLLRRFEREGWVELAREQIVIRDSRALRNLAA
jgi:CRP/FNR family transcriptional regulator